MKENKPQGFDVQDIRIGGLLQRITHCRNRILQYVNGETDEIPELNEPILDHACRTGKESGKPVQYCNGWRWAVTSNVL